ncbi:MAG: GDP-mannose 4,6-dehydratase [Clostridia bacterium]|nr:GDP-mannose 4,6-dehydratase [Clostridia bacterium]
MSERILILGAGGFVGPYLARELSRRGMTVIGSDRTETGPENLEYHRADLTDAVSVMELLHAVRPDAVVNLAAISSVSQSWRYPNETYAVNVGGAMNLLEAARRMDPMPRLLLIGSGEMYAPSESPLSEESPLDAVSPYGRTKLEQEHLARSYAERYGLRIACVRAFNHTGPGQDRRFAVPSWCRQAAAIEHSGRPGVIYAGNLNVRRDFSDVRDVVRAYRMILQSMTGGEIYNVGSGKAVLLSDLLAFIVSLSSQPIEVEINPSLVRPEENPVQICDRSRITKALGWKPERLMEDTVREMFAGELAALSAAEPVPPTDPRA